ncbi:MAG: Dihydrolipoyllysine-residue succinyltransferase component of 2-oxoglutarate dehydrogenase complex [Chlamydiales bacterium]|nr:Dihydrolipoyllysine-residue succinyltransferase component of 2-oxoglutarate dehydrogenase complex [Chlamydiales bacterium]MCH9635997.1 Dihydrolipoyllysine-residue succinyltransferase component of 2-oxoglutarate dehydrogenase complex [Chlamydiales bacterium]MCH9703758.1 dihydrolipoyllysine-residue succinyltransferase [Chlamydiota bacterium]
MKVEIKVPPMGESITEAAIGAFLVPAGSAVKESQEVIEIETEKVNQPLYAPASGEVSWTVKEGDTVTIGAVVGFVDTDKEGAVVEEREEAPPPAVEPKKPSGEIRKGVDDFVAGLAEKKEEPPKAVEKGERESRSEMSRIRKTIANRLVDSLHEAAMLTTFNEVDMTAVMALRAKYKESFLEQHGVKLGFMSFFVKAVVEALKAFPAFNSYLDGEQIVQRHYFDVGIAVGTEKGLVVPVVRDCESLSFAQIEQEIAAYAKRARSSALRIEDLEGGGFTITNGGVYGSLLSTPILNPPQVGILGMHAILNRPMAVDGKVEIRPMMYLALSYDHRIVDGKEAVSFLVQIKKVLEDPACMMLL